MVFQYLLVHCMILSLSLERQYKLIQGTWIYFGLAMLVSESYDIKYFIGGEIENKPWGKIHFWYCDIFLWIARYQICHRGGNINWSGGQKISFFPYGVFWCFTWYRIFYPLPISYMVHIILLLLFLLLILLVQNMWLWRFSCFYRLIFVTFLQVFTLWF